MWHLRHWLQFWQLRIWIHDNLCYLNIKSDTGQPSQFLRCFTRALLVFVFCVFLCVLFWHSTHIHYRAGVGLSWPTMPCYSTKIHCVLAHTWSLAVDKTSKQIWLNKEHRQLSDAKLIFCLIWSYLNLKAYQIFWVEFWDISGEISSDLYCT